MLYSMMIESLAPDESHPEKPRRDLDTLLQVDDWRVPGIRHRYRRPKPAPVEVEKVPSWWRGDEDASQTFMYAMGVVA